MIRRKTVLALALIAAGACSRHNNTPVDTTLNTDLSLAAQQRQPLDSINAAEHANALTTPATAPVASNTTTHRSSSSGVTHRTTHRSGSSSGSSAGSVATTTSSGHVEK